jgi:E3 ubiquitin-protein ligase RAD18
VGVQEGLINSHVDVCLTRGGAFGSAIAEAVGGESSPKDEFGNENSDEQYAMAKLPKLVYHIMKDKPLRKLLSDAGLSAVGRRDQLIDRHKEFTLRVNASIDSGHRPNLAAIAREVSKLERDRDRAGMMPAPGLIGSGGSGLAAAPPASKADVFGKLIADVRARRGAGAKARRDSSPVEDSEDDGDERELQGLADTLVDEGDVRVQEEATEGGVEVEVR